MAVSRGARVTKQYRTIFVNLKITKRKNHRLLLPNDTSTVGSGVPYSGHFLEHSIFDSKMSPIPDTVYILLCVPLSLPRLVATHTLALNLSRNLRAKVHGCTCEWVIGDQCIGDKRLLASSKEKAMCVNYGGECPE